MRNFVRIPVAAAALASVLALPAVAQAADSSVSSSTASRYMVCTYQITAPHHFVTSSGDQAFPVRLGQRFAGYRDLTAKINGVLHRQMEPLGLAWGQVGKMRVVPGSCRI
ncbi:hypothetical protein ACFWYW_56405 [Nonomuraea sp. NPDC059023]|uniref:hypothetical protein n=1 Tax=unclassified Nonomuraea TaxID=2593643 RepID=UPI0036C11628